MAIDILDVLGLVLDLVPLGSQFGKAQRAKFERRFQEICLVPGEQGAALLAAFCADCQRIIAKKPDDNHVLFRWGQALARRAALTSGQDQLNLYDEADSKFSQALRVDSNNGEIYLARVDALYRRAILSVGEEVTGRLLELSHICERRTGVYATGPHDARTLHYWGLALWTIATRRTGEEAQRLYEQADEKLRRAYAAFADPEFLVDLSRVRLWRALLEPPEQRRPILEQICAVLRDLNRKGKGGAAALAVWGKALGSMAWSSPGSDCERLYLESEEKLSRALHITPDDHETAMELLRVRGARALLLTGEARRKLMAQVSEESERLERRLHQAPGQ